MDLDFDHIVNLIASWVPAWVFIAVIVHLVVLGTVAYLILLERKVASWVQDRIGPNRVGFDFGLLPFLRGMNGFGQPLADGLKFIFKEDYRARGVDKILFTLAPGLMIVVIIISIAVIPWGGVMQTTRKFDVTRDVRRGVDPRDAGLAAVPIGASPVSPNGAVPPPPAEGMAGGLGRANAELARAQAVRDTIPVETRNEVTDEGGITRTYATVTYRYAFQIADLNIGVLFILAALSLAVYGVVIGGWASNNKYSFLGGLRATVNMISYEIPMGLCVLCIVVMFGTLDLGEIVNKQAHYWVGFIPAWNVFTQPLAFLMFLVCIHAEANRAPFDLAEAEQELVGGYHTEYSSMRFALFFLGEYAGMITTSAVCVALFFGGWHLPWVEWAWPALKGNVAGAGPEVTTSLVAAIARGLIFFLKTLIIIFVFMWVRWSLPRFRFDQLMMLAWRALIPISLALLLMNALVLYFARGLLQPGLLVDGRLALVFVVANVILLAATMIVSTLLPAPPDMNRKIAIPGSRFLNTPLPARA